MKKNTLKCYVDDLNQDLYEISSMHFDALHTFKILS